MNKKLLFLFISMIALALAACTNSGKNNTDDGLPEIIEVQLEVAEKANVDEKIVLKADVTQGGESVKDADEVEFEIWEEGKKDDSIMLESVNEKDGSYTAETSFDHDGVFTVQVHVTARGMHSMPKKSVTVGEGASEEHGDEDHHSHGDHQHGDGDHADGFSMHFIKPNHIDKKKETELVLHLEDNDGPLEDARVRYEIWNDEISEKHEWVDAEEMKPGEYTGSHTFSESGIYTIQVHVQNDEGLHEHEEHKIEVK